MPDVPLSDVLEALGESWKAPPGLAETDLATVRAAVRTTRSRGAVSVIKHDSSAENAAPATPVAPVNVTRLRSDVDLDLAAAITEPLTAHPQKTLGPFVDKAGISHWVDIFPIVQKVTLESTTHGVLAELSAKAIPPADLGAGSIWIAASAFGIGGGGSIGLAFKSAKSRVDGTLQGQPGKILIGPGVKLTLALKLAAAPVPPAAAGIGADAAALSLALPATATLEFSAGGVALTAFDDLAATVYGTPVACTNAKAPPQRVDLPGEFILFPCDAAPAQYAIASCVSADVALAGKAPLAKPSGWAFPVVTDSVKLAGDAQGEGALALSLGKGLTLAVPEQPRPVPLGPTHLLLGPGTILIAGTIGGNVTQRFSLWDAPAPDPAVVPPPARHRSELRVRAKRGSSFVALVSGTAEELLLVARVDANVDRPLGADGRRLALAFDDGRVGFVRSALGERIAIVGLAPNATTPAGPLALENALVRCGPARSLFAVGNRIGPRIAGSLGITFDLATIVPTLPDPYAASFDAGRLPGQQTKLLATVTWPAGTPNLTFATLGTNDVAQDPALTHETPRALAAVGGGFILLDLSTKADQFGVQVLGGRTATPPSVSGLALVAPQQSVAVYALPGISWEPVVDDRTNDWYDAQSVNDGPPTRLVARSVTLVPTEPAPVLRALHKVSADVDVFGEFTLPFGLTARLGIDATASPGASRPVLSLVPGSYTDELAGALQLAIAAGTLPPPGALPGSGPALPGSTSTGAPIPLTPALPTHVYGAQILGANEFIEVDGVRVRDSLSAAQFFDPQFAAGQAFPEIPVSRIDISGYGTSMFSDWRNPQIAKPPPPPQVVGVVRSRFDVLVGRTAFEMVQIQSFIVPWSVRLIRTIVFERFDSGLIVRHDSGWKAVDDGRFELLHPGQAIAGALARLTAVRNIQVAAGAPISFTSPDVDEYLKPGTKRTIDFAPVTSDADVILANGVSGIANGRPASRIAATRIRGYVQRTPGYAASPAEIVALMQAAKARGITLDGALGAIVNVGAAATEADPKFTLNVSSFSADVTTANVPGQAYPAVAVALHGVPRLPRDGSWSIGRRAQTATAPTAVNPNAPIPLVRAIPSGGAAQWRLLDPQDALSVANPQQFYGLLQSAGTSKAFFEHLIVDNAGQELGFDPAHPPNLADVGALLGAADIFPNLGNVLNIPPAVADAFKLASDGFKKTFDWQITDPDRELFKLGVIRLVLSYKAQNGSPTKAHLALDPLGSPRFVLALTGLTFAAYVDGLSSDPLLQIHGNFGASDSAAPGFNNIQVDYGSALGLIKSIISGLSELVKSLGGDVDLDIGFSGSQLTVHQGFVLPTIPLGLGEVRDVGIDLGLSIDIPSSAKFNVGIGGKRETGDDTGLKLKPFTWIVDPLTGNGAMSLGVVDGDLAVYIEAGIGAALAIDLAIASGSASITLELAISTDQKPFVLAITLVGQAQVDVLGGLVSASLTLAAGIAILPEFPAGSALPNAVDLTAMVAVGIHISICWVISVDFDGSWQFSETIPLHLP